MATPNREIMTNINESWSQLSRSLSQALDNLEKEIEDAAQTQDGCTDEWCAAVEHAIDDYAGFLFGIHEPRWMPDEETRKLKQLRRRLHQLYASYKTASNN